MFKIQNKTCSGIMQIKVLSKAEGVMCVWGGDITLASVLRNLNFA